MRQKILQTNDGSFKIKFSSGESIFNKLNFTKTNSNFGFDSMIHPTGEDIYYDEIVYYDGGGVEGYGD